MDELARILTELRQRREAPLETAMTLPPQAYRSADLLSLETERIFRREWICAGREDEIAAAGDYLCFDVANEPIVVIRDETGVIRAFSNVCGHRSAQLKSGRGNCASLQCPYHAWNYDLHGRLQTAPYMERAKDFQRSDVRLPEFRVETWLGFVFVNLDNDAPPLSPRLAGLHAKLTRYPIAECKTVVRADETWNANWKVVLENAMESYHVFRVHAKTINSFLSMKTIECVPGDDGYNLNSMRSKMSARPDDALVWQATVYPSLVIYSGPLDHMRLSWLTALPLGTGQSRVVTGQAFPHDQESDPAAMKALVTSTRAENDIVNAEDRPICESVQRGISSELARAGRLSHVEAPVWEFGRYLARRVS